MPMKLTVVFHYYDINGSYGRIGLSNSLTRRRLPSEVKNDPELFSECLGGALYLQDFYRLCHKVGFTDPRVLSSRELCVGSDLAERLGGGRFYSITFRCFKLPDLEEGCQEDYGQVATYIGGVEGSKWAYKLDKDNLFHLHKPTLVSGNTAALLSSPSWLSKYFEVRGGRRVHYGAFVSGGSMEAADRAPEAMVLRPKAEGGCCG